MGFNVTGDSYTFSTGWGACFTIIVAVLTIIYAAEKLFVQKMLAILSTTHLRDPYG